MIGVDDSNDPNPSANANEASGAGLPESRLDNDEVFDALTHERRRYLLYALLEDERWSLRDLAAKLAAWENGVQRTHVDRREVEKVYASLYHAHVPKLVDYGILDFERTEESIERGPRAKSTLHVLQHTGASESEAIEAHVRGDYDDR